MRDQLGAERRSGGSTESVPDEVLVPYTQARAGGGRDRSLARRRRRGERRGIGRRGDSGLQPGPPLRPDQECLDRRPIVSEAHLRQVRTAYAGYFDRARPRQGLDRRIPLAAAPAPRHGPVRCRAAPGGPLRDYYREAA